MKSLRDGINKTHGGSGSVEYGIWQNMKNRCKDLNDTRYGGRGIKVCERWVDSFENFMEDMGKRPDKKLSLERRNNDGNYSKENCTWATRKEQSANRSTNINIEYKGEKMILSEWAKVLKIPYPTLLGRITKGWSIEDAFTIPVNLGNKNIGDRGAVLNNSKFILDTQTGIFYSYIQEACDAKGVAKTTLGYMLRGVRKNKTSLIYV